MPRGPRLLLSKSYYHIMTRGNNRSVVFPHQDDFKHYLELILRLKKEHPFGIYHYCLMPNHVHFLIKTKKGNEFSHFMKRLNLIYFYYFKKKYSWVGHFWQGRFKSQPVGKDAYFIQCGKYIELNPVRAGLVSNPEDYQYSSYNYYARGLTDKLVSQDMFYQDLGKTSWERQGNYRKMIINDIIQSTYQNKVWGSASQRYNEVKKINYRRKRG